MTHRLTFDAIAEARPGPKWKSRWDWSWPAYEAWFRGRGGDDGPSRQACEQALEKYMPELVPTYRDLVRLAGDGDREARFLSTWCPPAYLGGCSLAARSEAGRVRLVRNYDLSPDLNEGLLLRSEWTGEPVMGMVEFLWGLSDGVNASGLAVALAYGGSRTVGRGFGITTIVRYILEVCRDVPSALEKLPGLPSHMAYNLVLADRAGRTASVEMLPGGGLRLSDTAVATNHQHDGTGTERTGFNRTVERRAHLEGLMLERTPPEDLRGRFLQAPLLQDEYGKGFGTLFTADYDPVAGAMALSWPDETWPQTLDAFSEGRRHITYTDEAARDWAEGGALADMVEAIVAGSTAALDDWLAESRTGEVDWVRFGRIMAETFSGTGGEASHWRG